MTRVDDKPESITVDHYALFPSEDKPSTHYPQWDMIVTDFKCVDFKQNLGDWFIDNSNKFYTNITRARMPGDLVGGRWTLFRGMVYTSFGTINKSLETF